MPPRLPLAVPSSWPWSLAATCRVSWGKRQLWCLSGLPLKQDAQKSWLCLQVEGSRSKAPVGVPVAKLTEPTLEASQTMVVTHINGVFLCSTTCQVVDFGQGCFISLDLYFLICKMGYHRYSLPVRIMRIRGDTVGKRPKTGL